MPQGKPRDPRKEQHWRQLIERWQRSGLVRPRLLPTPPPRRSLLLRLATNACSNADRPRAPSRPSPLPSSPSTSSHDDTDHRNRPSNSSSPTAAASASRRLRRRRPPRTSWPRWRTPHAEPLSDHPHLPLPAKPSISASLRQPQRPRPPGPRRRPPLGPLVRLPQPQRAIGSRSWPGRRTAGACGISDSKQGSFASPPAAGDGPPRVWRSAPPSWPCSWTASSWRRCNAASAITARPRPSDPRLARPGPPHGGPVSLPRHRGPSFPSC